MHKMRYIHFFSTIALLFVAPHVALAQGGGLGQALSNLKKAGGPTGAEGNLESVAGTAISTALSLVGLIFLILMVYGGYLWMTARGEEDQVKKAQQIIVAAIIGLVVVISAYAITFFVTSRFQS